MKTIRPMRLAVTAISVIALSSSHLALAGSGSGNVEIEWVGGYVSGASYGPGQLVFFYTTSHVGPACNSYRQRWVLDASTPQGKQQYALLLSAQLSGKAVIVAGTNDCALWGDSEGVFTVGYVVAHP
jgi:hypothetical protein